MSVQAWNLPLFHEAMARHAVDLANAILNHVYAILEGQTRQALAAVGFDLARGFLPADRQGSDALVHDLMERAPPARDDHVLTCLQAMSFQAGDFIHSALPPVTATATREHRDGGMRCAAAAQPCGYTLADLAPPRVMGSP
jgi:CRISPR associated protein Cas1